MKAEELMIGDWVQNDELPCKVISIAQNGIYFVDAKSEGIATFDRIKPIPLTPEILKKNGFGYIEKDDWVTHFYPGEPQFCKDMNLHIGTDGKGNYWLNTFSNTIYGLKFLHELQHALKICRIDKTIEL